MQMVKGSCPNCHQVIDVDLDNQANICPFCKQAYVTLVCESFSILPLYQL